MIITSIINDIKPMHIILNSLICMNKIMNESTLMKSQKVYKFDTYMYTYATFDG